MKTLAKWLTSRNEKKNTTTITATFEGYLDAKFVPELKTQFAARYIEENYDELVKLVDQDEIVKTITATVISKILEGYKK